MTHDKKKPRRPHDAPPGERSLKSQRRDTPESDAPARENRDERPRRPARDFDRDRDTRAPRGWDSVAAWYDGWVGTDGSEHHKRLAIPEVMRLLQLQRGERVLDVGCGQGVLAPHIAQAGGDYVGVDVSPRLLGLARKHHGSAGEFLKGDALKLWKTDGLATQSFDAVVFLLSIQDIDPLDAAVRSASWALKDGGRMVFVMTHPAFRVPRQSGWGVDEGRKLTYRRVDRYLTPLPIPMKTYPGKSGVTISHHRPISAYINTLGEEGLLVDRFDEIPSYKRENDADQEFPLFLGLRARKLAVPTQE